MKVELQSHCPFEMAIGGLHSSQSHSRAICFLVVH